MEVNNHPTPGASAPYGHACSSCAKAKCKCISRGSGSCERCHRRGLECRASDAVRKRNSKKSGATSRTSQLEERLEDLVTLLRSQQSAGKLPLLSADSELSSVLKPRSSNGDEQASSISLCPSSPHGAQHSASAAYPSPSNTFSASNSQTSPSSTISNYGDELTETEAESILLTFRTIYLVNFPLVFIPSDMSAQRLQLERPFLWMNIRGVCSKSTLEIRTISDKIRETLGRKIFVELERDMDLLLGLLVHLGWSTHYTRGKSFLSRFANIANALVSDLRLDRPVEVSVVPSCWNPTGQTPSFPAQSNEQLRAVIATFLLCSSKSNFLRIDLVRWNSHMEGSLEKLAAKPECFGDEVLVAITRAALIVEDVARVTWRQSDYATAATPILYVKPLRARLDQLKKSLSPQALQEKIVLSHIYNAEILINEMAIFHPTGPMSMPSIGPEGPTMFPIPSMNAPATEVSSHSIHHWYKPLNIPRLEILQQCLEAIKSSFANYFRYPSETYPGIPFALLGHFSHAIQILYRLSILDEPDWDRNAVRQSADIIAILAEAADKMSMVPVAAGIIDDKAYPYIFTKGAAVLRNTIAIWDASLAQYGVSGVDISMAASAPTSNDVTYPGDTMPTMMEFGTEAWLADMFTSWDT